MVGGLDVAAKVALALFIVLVAVDPSWGNLEGKAPLQRAVLYPVVAIVVPALWRLGVWKQKAYPWTADLLLTLIGFSDVLGNRLDLFDSVVWFDDWMHFANAFLLCAALLSLTTNGDAGPVVLLERSIAAAMTVALAWELWEYFSFVVESREFAGAYADTVGDFSLAWIGAVTGAAVVYGVRRVAARDTQRHSRAAVTAPLPAEAPLPVEVAGFSALDDAQRNQTGDLAR